MEYLDNLITRQTYKCTGISLGTGTGSVLADSTEITADSTVITVDATV